MSRSFEVAVIGGGAAGTMAALRSVLSLHETAIFLGDLDAKRRSRAQWVSAIDDMPGFFGETHPITKSTLDAFQWIDTQEFLKSKLTVVKTSIQTVTKLPEGFELTWTEKRRRDPVATSHTAQARHVVLATGIMDVQPHIRGSIEHIFSFANANQVLYCLRSDGHRLIGKRTAVVGHTERAAWTAITLHERYALPELTIVTHGERLDVPEEVRALLRLYGIRVLEGTIEEIVGHARKEGLQGLKIEGELLTVEGVFVDLGLIVYHELAQRLGAALDDQGFVLTDAAGETTVSGLYAIGDLQSARKKQIYTAWESAVDAVDAIDERLRREKRAARLAQAVSREG